jgi:hypothetical protein
LGTARDGDRPRASSAVSVALLSRAAEPEDNMTIRKNRIVVIVITLAA